MLYLCSPEAEFLPKKTEFDKTEGQTMCSRQWKRKRRLRKCQTPHAEMANAARGDCNRRTRRFESKNAAWKSETWKSPF